MTQALPLPDVDRFPSLAAGDYCQELEHRAWIGRVYFASGPWPSTWQRFRFFGPTERGRFDHHPEPEGDHEAEGIWYGAPKIADRRGEAVPALDTCLAEVFRDHGVVDRWTGTPCFAAFQVARPLRLLDLVDSNWVTVAGGNAAISSGVRWRSRAWSRAIHHVYDVDGLFYECANMPRGRSVALFERAREALPLSPALNLPLSHDGLDGDMQRACADLGLDLL